jgi:acyl-CoA dehydrogenase
MPNFPGFKLPDELRILSEQIRRFIKEEIVPLEQRIDPDAPSIPEEDFERLSAKTKAAGLWALGAPEEYGGGGLDTFSMCVALEEMSQHRMGLYSPGCGTFGRYPPPAIWAGSKAQIEKYAVPTIREGWRTFFAITEPLAAPIPPAPSSAGRAARRQAGAERAQGLHLQRAQRQVGIVFARSNKEEGRSGISCLSWSRARPASRPSRSGRSIPRRFPTTSYSRTASFRATR